MDGEMVMDRFRLLERIGSGGMGTVYRAFDERLLREVAVKEVEAVEPARVLREAQAAARLNHPGIVTLYELGERAGRALLVSELVPGHTLRAASARGELTDRDVAELVADLCEALDHAHARDVVHRDVKPENVVVREEIRGGRRAKLMDFGIARVAGAPTLTEDGEVVGTLAYMSPEQAEGLEADAPSDVYSLALTAYECWAGENPVAGSNPAETVRRIGEGVPSLRTYRPDLPEGLVATVDACLDADPFCRPHPLELRDCLEAELDALDGARALPAPGEPERAHAGRRRGIAALAVALALAALITLIAGPGQAPGLALVLAALAVPAALLAPGLPSLAAPLGGIFAALGIAGGAPALCALAPRPFERAALGALAWLWVLAAAIALGAGPDPGFASTAPAGWEDGAGPAFDSVLRPLLGPEGLLGAALCAGAAVLLGWILTARHLPVALLGALVWAAALDAGLAALVPELGGRPLAAGLAAAAAVTLEFGLIRERGAPPSLRRAAAPAPGLG